MDRSNQNILGFSKDIIRRDIIFGTRRFSNYVFNGILFLCGLCLFLGGLSRRQQKSIIPFLDITEIQFLPQGIIICFYGLISIRLRSYFFVRGSFAVGTGFTEYNKEKKQIRIFRWGFPGNNRQLEIIYPFSELESLQIENLNRFIRPMTLNLYLILKKNQKILITGIDIAEILSTQKAEIFATKLAQFLQIPLEGTS